MGTPIRNTRQPAFLLCLPLFSPFIFHFKSSAGQCRVSSAVVRDGGALAGRPALTAQPTQCNLLSAKGPWQAVAAGWQAASPPQRPPQPNRRSGRLQTTKKMAAQAQAQKQGEITALESMELVRCLLRVVSGQAPPAGGAGRSATLVAPPAPRLAHRA